MSRYLVFTAFVLSFLLSATVETSFAGDFLHVSLSREPDGAGGYEYCCWLQANKTGATTGTLTTPSGTYDLAVAGGGFELQDDDDYDDEFTTFAELSAHIEPGWTLVWDNALPTQTTATINFGTISESEWWEPCPTFTNPPDGATNVSPDVVMEWTYGGPTEGIGIEIGLNGPDSRVYFVNDLPATALSWTPPVALVPGEWEAWVAYRHEIRQVPEGLTISGDPWLLDNFYWLQVYVGGGSEFVVPEPATVLPSDNFNDNSMDTSLWNLYEEDHINAWLDETNARLEFRSTADADDAAALYIASDWGFLPTADFSFRVDFHYSSTVTAGSVLLGIRKDEKSGENEVWLDAGYEEAATPYSAFFWDATANGNKFDGGEQSRSLDDGTLYISYNAATDDLYVSGSGYWADNAWGTISGLVQGAWDADRVSPLLGGCSGEMDGALPSGGAYLDNFVVDSGTIVPSSICEYALAGDLNNDCKVDFRDFVLMAENWLIDCQANPSNSACVHK